MNTQFRIFYFDIQFLAWKKFETLHVLFLRLSANQIYYMVCDKHRFTLASSSRTQQIMTNGFHVPSRLRWQECMAPSGLYE